MYVHIYIWNLTRSLTVCPFSHPLFTRHSHVGWVCLQSGFEDEYPLVMKDGVLDNSPFTDETLKNWNLHWLWGIPIAMFDYNEGYNEQIHRGGDWFFRLPVPKRLCVFGRESTAEMEEILREKFGMPESSQRWTKSCTNLVEPEIMG